MDRSLKWLKETIQFRGEQKGEHQTPMLAVVQGGSHEKLRDLCAKYMSEMDEVDGEYFLDKFCISCSLLPIVM